MSEADHKVVIYSSIKAEATAITTRSLDDRDSTYSLNRFLSEPTHASGYRPAQSPAEAQKRMHEELRKFETKFSSSGSDLQLN